jgi:hypothetical protein
VNRATQNALAGLIVRLALLVFGGYLVFSESSIPGATTWARAGLAATAFALVLALGEIARLTKEVRMMPLVSAGILTAADPKARDDRKAVDILIIALSAGDPDTREKAHRNLVRLTGQGLPPDPKAWSEWWASAREGFEVRRD